MEIGDNDTNNLFDKTVTKTIESDPKNHTAERLSF